MDFSLIFQVITQIFIQLTFTFFPSLGILAIIWFLISSIPIWIIYTLFNFAGTISLASEFFILVTLALLFCFLPLANVSSELFSKLGIYHSLSKIDSPFGETVAKKVIKVYWLNVQLSVVTFIVIVFFVATIIQFKEPLTSEQLFNLIISAVAICPALLLSLRLLANPVKIVPKFQGLFKILNWIFPLSYLARPNDDSETIRRIKERFVSLYYSMIATVLFTLTFLYVYLATIHGGQLFNYMYSFFAPSILGINPYSALILMFVFLIVLFFTTAIGELFLKKFEVMEIKDGLIF